MTFREAAAFAAVLALAAALAFQHLALHGLWLDEAWSVYMATVDLGMFKYRLKTREANMSLYYLLLRGWVDVFGSTEAAVRALSATFATGAVAALYALGRRLLGPAAGLSAAFLLALNGFHLYYAHDARSYSLVELLVTLAALALALLLARPSWLRAAGYAATAGASLYAHIFAALALAAQAAALPFLGWHRLPWRHLALAFAGTALAAAPLAAFVLLRDVGQVDWIQPVALRDLYDLALELAGGGRLLALAYGALCALALARAPWRGEGRQGARWPYVLALLWFLVPPVVAYAVSLLKPLFVDRYLIVSLPALALLAGAGLARLPRPWLFAAAVLVVAALSLRPGATWHERGRSEDWRGAARFVLEAAREGDALVVYGGPTRHAFDYYRARLGAMERPPETVYPRWEAYRNEPTQELLDSLVARHPRVWLVLSHHWGASRRAGLRSILQTLERDYARGRQRDFENVVVRLYER